jgi:acetate CoA/acetoacetate CoA-transferase alpha subunit
MLRPAFAPDSKASLPLQRDAGNAGPPHLLGAGRRAGRDRWGRDGVRRTISAEEAAELVPDGASVMLCGPRPGVAPTRLVEALVARHARLLTIIAFDLASPSTGVGRLIEAGCVARAVVAQAGANPVARKRMMRGELAIELLGLDRFTECIRAAGRGLGGLLVRRDRRLREDSRRVIDVDGVPHLLERPLRAQFALLAASRSDAFFNLAYAHGTPNVASFMASAADCVIGEPDIVKKAALPSSVLQTSGVVVDYLVRAAR